MADDEDHLRSRFRDAALTLFTEHGFERTTAAQIARAAGVTERTFFRYYPDKRDVLFEGEAMVRMLLIAGIGSAPGGLGPLDTLLRAFRVLQPVIEVFRPFAKARRTIVRNTATLREREGMRAAALIDSLATALQRRDVDRATAMLAAHASLTAFDLAGRCWLDGEDPELGPYVDRAFAELKLVLASARELKA